MVTSRKGTNGNIINSMTNKDDDIVKQEQRPPAGTFANQEDLPRLPIPTLEETFERFSRCIEPLLTSKADQDEALRVIQSFQANEGPHLQKLLQMHDKKNQEGGCDGSGSYVEEFWTDAYLAPDTSVVLNLNPFFLLEEDPDAKKAHDQVARAASLTFSSLKFAASLKNETVTPDSFRGTPLCMDQFHALFGSCRVPKVGEKDVVEVDTESGHVVVLFRNQFYYFQGLWPHSPGEADEEGDDVELSPPQYHKKATVTVSESDIRSILQTIVHDGKKVSLQETVNTSALGVLTTLPRKQWADAREKLIQSSEHNQSALDIIDSALFVLVLDDFMPKDIHEAAANMLHGTRVLKPVESAGEEDTSTEDHVAIGVEEYQAGTCCNRWYDKLQLIVCSDGSAGINFEHSAIDGHTALRFASDIYAETIVTFAKSITKAIYTSECPIPTIIDATLIRSAASSQTLDTSPKKLKFDLSDLLKDRMFYAEAMFGDALNADDTFVLEFKRFGKNLIVNNKMSPDSVVQMSMILAYYSLYGEVVCAYEPVLTKKFLHGRTEAMRSTTSKAVELCRIWTDRFASKEDKLNALREATKYHSKLTREASEGKGVDRHLYALKCIAEKNDIPVPDFFQSKAWDTLNHTVLSTSNCGNPALRLFGFGPVTPDGFGIGYIIKDNGLQYSISSKHRQTRRYANTLHHTLLQIEQLLENADCHSIGYHGAEPLARSARSKSPVKKANKNNGLEYVEGAYDGTYGEVKAPDNLKIGKKKKMNPFSCFVGTRTLKKETSLKSVLLSQAGTDLSHSSKTKKSYTTCEW